MYKVRSAWIEQVLEFESEADVFAYKKKLESGRAQIYKIVEESCENGKILLHIRKQYNNNCFPDF